MNRSEASKLDAGRYYVDLDPDGLWYVFGTESGFAYVSCSFREEAEDAKRAMELIRL